MKRTTPPPIGQSGIPPLVTELSLAIQNGDFAAFDLVPALIVRCFEEKVWEQCWPPFPSFTAWVTAPNAPGMNRPVEDLRKFCTSLSRTNTPPSREVSKRALALIDGEIPALPEHGVNQHSVGGSVPISGAVRNRTYIIARLKRDHPDLHARVIAGEMTANAAAHKVGILKVPTPLQKVLKLLPKLSDAEWQQVVEARGL